MKKIITSLTISSVLVFLFSGCGPKSEAPPAFTEKSYAIYAEYAKSPNKRVVAGLNRRVFDSVEAQCGKRINLETDGSITLLPGTYHITGYSMVSMQASTKVPVLGPDSVNYPGYCLVYPTKYTTKEDVMKNAFGISSAAPASDMIPCIFDCVYTCTEKTPICVSHQSGDDLKVPIYLSVYDVEGAAPTPYHVFARISITEL